MAEGKKSFVAYSDWYGMFKALPDDVAGKLIKHIFSYVNDENPTTDDFIINALFEQVKSTLKRDLKKWQEQQEQRKQAGIRSAEIRKQNATLVNVRSISSTDSVNVNDSVNVITTISDVGVIEFKDAVSICMFSEQWKEDVERLYKIDRNKIQFALNEFSLHCGTTGENKPKTLNQFKKHFTNWVRVKKQYQVKTEIKDKL